MNKISIKKSFSTAYIKILIHFCIKLFKVQIKKHDQKQIHQLYCLTNLTKTNKFKLFYLLNYLTENFGYFLK